MHLQTIVILLLIATAPLLCVAQPVFQLDTPKEDSLCMYGTKYDWPERRSIKFPAVNVANSYKIKEIHRALPDSLKNKDNRESWLYNYFFGTTLTDYSDKLKRTFIPKQNSFLYKLKDTYFFDINGDGRLDFIHYPKYYMAIMRDFDTYELYLNTADGYKIITFHGYIFGIDFDTDGSLRTMSTFQGPCCDDTHCRFMRYKFDKSSHTLTLVNTVEVLTCQLRGEWGDGEGNSS